MGRIRRGEYRDIVQRLLADGYSALVVDRRIGGSLLHLAAERAREMSGVLAFSPASGEPMQGCRPEQYLPSLSIPALILRPEAESNIETLTQQLGAFRAAGKQIHISDPEPTAHRCSARSGEGAERMTPGLSS
jgi:hypothetical protein